MTVHEHGDEIEMLRVEAAETFRWWRKAFATLERLLAKAGR